MIALLLLLALALPSDDTALVDLRPYQRPVPQTRAGVLGIQRLSSWAGWFDEEEPEDVGGLTIGGITETLEVATGLGATEWETEAGRYLHVPRRHLAEVRRELASLSADTFRVVRVAIEVTFPDGSVTRGQIATRHGAWGAFGPTASRRFHTDNDVEIACSNSEYGEPSVIVDPIVHTAHEGIWIEVRPFLLDDAGAVALDATVQAGRFDRFAPDLDLRARDHGRLQLPGYSGAAAAVSGRVEPGKDLVARLDGPSGTTVVRLVPTVSGDAGRGRIRYLPRSLEGIGAAPLVPVNEWEGTPGAFKDAASAAFPLFGWTVPDDLGGLCGGEAEIRDGQAARAEQASDLGRTVHVTIRRLDGDRETGRFDLSALTGRTAIARAGRDVMILQDWDVEVGCYNQIGDPILGPVFSGDHARARPFLSPDARRVILALRYESRETAPGRPPESGMIVTGAIHPVRTTVLSFSGELVLTVGEERIIPLGNGRSLAIRCRTNLEPEPKSR